jgi:protease-4
MNNQFFTKLGSFLGTVWSYITVGRDFFWKAIRFTFATGIFLFVAIGILNSLISPLWTGSDKPDSEGKVVVFKPSGVVVDQEPGRADLEWWEQALEESLGEGESTRVYQYRDMIKFFEDFKNDENVDAMIFDPSGLGIQIPYVLAIAEKIKEAVDAGKEIVVRSDYLNDVSYVLASAGSEISSQTYAFIDINGFGSPREYYKDFLEKFLITPRIFSAGDFKTGPEQFTRDSMSEEAKINLEFYEPLWAKFKNFVQEQRNIDLQWIADDAWKQLVNGEVDEWTAALDWGLVDIIEENDDFDARMIEKFGASENDEEELNAIYFRDYLETLPKDKPIKSDNAVKVVAIEGAITGGDVLLGSAGSDGIVEMLKDAHKNEDTKAIVLRVNSPGGSVVASDYIRWEIEKAKEKGIPVVVSMGSLAASGGYWVSSLADKIYAESDTITGSIGVFGTQFSVEKIYDWMGINIDGYSTTRWGAFDPVRQDWPKEFEELVRSSVNSIYVKFTTQTSIDRNIPLETVKEIAKGRVYSGKRALEIGLVDEIGNLNDAITFAASLAEIDDYKIDYVRPPAPNGGNFMLMISAWAEYIKTMFGISSNKPLQQNIIENTHIYCYGCLFED